MYKHPFTDDVKTFPADNVAGFKLYYGDGYVHVGKTLKRWHTAPPDNLQFIMLYLQEKDRQGRPLRYVISGSDYYAYDGMNFQHSNDSRLLKGVILNGKWTTDENYEAIDKKAMADYNI